LIPANYEQFLQVRRQQLALKEQERSLQYEKLLADLNASIIEWRDQRRKHPGPGTMTVLRAQARWLVPIFATVANPTLLVQPWFLLALTAKGQTEPVMENLYGRWTVWRILKDDGVKRRR